jgi:hypothetical protein
MSKKIKSIQIRRHDLVINDLGSNELEEQARKYKFTEYNKDGNIIKEINFAPDGSTEEYVERKYDKNQLVEELFYDEDNNLIERKTYQYNKQDKPETETKHYMDGSYDLHEYIYDNEGKLMKKICKDDENIVEQVDYFHYSEDKLIKHESYNDNNELVKKLTYNYDDKGNVSESSIFDEETNDDFRIVNEFNDKSERTGFLKYDSEGNLLEKSNFRYDNHGNIINIIDESPLVLNKTFMKYDSQGNMIMQEEYNENEQLNHRIERKFDPEGNILETRVFIDYHGEGMNKNYLLKYEYEFFD